MWALFLLLAIILCVQGEWLAGILMLIAAIVIAALTYQENNHS